MITNIPDKFAAIMNDVEEMGFVSITRLTVIKKWFSSRDRLFQFGSFIAKKAISRKGKTADGNAVRLFKDAGVLFNDIKIGNDQIDRRTAEKLVQELRNYQNEYKPVPFGVARIIRNRNLLLIEKAIELCLCSQCDGTSGYQLAADYFRSYDSSHGEGLYSSALYKMKELLQFMYTTEAREEWEE